MKPLKYIKIERPKRGELLILMVLADKYQEVKIKEPDKLKEDTLKELCISMLWELRKAILKEDIGQEIFKDDKKIRLMLKKKLI
jgi:hypothetical protein